MMTLYVFQLSIVFFKFYDILSLLWNLGPYEVSTKKVHFSPLYRKAKVNFFGDTLYIFERLKVLIKIGS